MNNKVRIGVLFLSANHVNALEYAMKQLHPWLRTLLYTGSFLVFVAGIQLFVLTEHTDVYFAWPISSRLSAATLGAFYWGTMFFGFFSARETLWAKARGAVPAVIVFTSVSLAVTILHLDDFRFSSSNPITLIVTWTWVLVYFIEPPLLIIVFLLQLRERGSDPEREHTLPIWFRIVLVLQGLLAIGVALALLFFLGKILAFWPWSLSEYTAGALAAWMSAVGVIGLQAAWENDWARIRITMISYLIFSILEFIAIFRYPSELHWYTAGEISYLLFLMSMLGVGAYGWVQTQPAASSEVEPN
ncbi:MAG TPA: hypothetical protein VLZ89_15875 [Anaerolineales bacterium]|nr:hypothetical protein [Anaerolineales bacterium]